MTMSEQLARNEPSVHAAPVGDRGHVQAKSERRWSCGFSLEGVLTRNSSGIVIVAALLLFQQYGRGSSQDTTPLLLQIIELLPSLDDRMGQASQG